MKVQQLFNSLPILQRVIELKLPIKKAYDVYILTKHINEQKDFFIKEEKKLIDKFNAEVLENGKVRINNYEDRAKFAEEYNDLMQYEINDLIAVELNFNDLNGVEFAPQELMLLEGVINFKE